jgi:hypothetical protein
MGARREGAGGGARCPRTGPHRVRAEADRPGQSGPRRRCDLRSGIYRRRRRRPHPCHALHEASHAQKATGWLCHRPREPASLRRLSAVAVCCVCCVGADTGALRGILLQGPADVTATQRCAPRYLQAYMPLRRLLRSTLRATAARRHVSIRVRGEIMGPGKYESVGKSQSVLIMISPIVSPRTRMWISAAEG